MNEKGFTLVELIAVIILIALVAMITFPNLNNLRKNNNEKEFTTYENLMVEHAKILPIQKYRNSDTNRGYICHSQLNMKPINDSIICNGYVEIDGNNLFPYLYCTQNGEEVWKTKVYSDENIEEKKLINWSIPSDC